MIVRVDSPNPALIEILRSPNQILTLDANVLIPSRRSAVGWGFSFSDYKEIWLDPLFSSFSNLAVHEAVLEELVDSSIRSYVQSMLDSSPPRLIIHSDSNLTAIERALRDSVLHKIAPLTKYDPSLDNKDDRGEVKTLAYLAVKELKYFAARDSNAILLIEKAQEWDTGLDNIQVIQMHELIYYLLEKGAARPKPLRALYKYLYHLTQKDKQSNPEWNRFVSVMKGL